jgi:hypothetical protein
MLASGGEVVRCLVGRGGWDKCDNREPTGLGEWKRYLENEEKEIGEWQG